MNPTKISELNIGLTDTSAKEFADELLVELRSFHSNLNTHAMTDRTAYLEGRKKMLSEIIDYITKAKP